MMSGINWHSTVIVDVGAFVVGWGDLISIWPIGILLLTFTNSSVTLLGNVDDIDFVDGMFIQ